MASPKTIRTMAGTTRPAGTAIQVPVDTNDVAATIEQLQATLNALIVKHDALVTAFDAHTHGGVTAGAATTEAPTASGAAATATPQSASGKFTA